MACECYDMGCKAHAGSSVCEATGRTRVLYRVDMEDHTGTAMCPGCRADAELSGLFDTERNFYSR